MSNRVDPMDRIMVNAVLGEKEPDLSKERWKDCAKTKTNLQKIAKKLFTKKYESLSELAEDLPEVPRWVIIKAANDPQFCAYLAERAEGYCKLGLVQTHKRCYELAMKGDNPKYMELYWRRFDPGFSQIPEAQVQENTQINIFQSYTEEELRSLTRSLRRRVLGEGRDAEFSGADPTTQTA